MKTVLNAVEMGRIGGKATSTAKVEAARTNGARGGRPTNILKALQLGLQYANLYAPPEETGAAGVREHERDLLTIRRAIQQLGGAR